MYADYVIKRTERGHLRHIPTIKYLTYVTGPLKNFERVEAKPSRSNGFCGSTKEAWEEPIDNKSSYFLLKELNTEFFSLKRAQHRAIFS